MKNKLVETFEEAIADIPEGATIMLHSFGGPGGIAQNLILALRNQGAKNLTLIGCNLGVGAGITRRIVPTSTGWKEFKPYITPNLLVENGQVKKAIISYVGVDTPLREAMKAGKVEWELSPQGTLAERIRAGAAGIGGFYSPVGIGTLLEQGKEKKIINGKEYLLELPLRADYAFVRAYKADKMGNLVYRGTSRHFNPLIAAAANITIAEVDEIVEPGELDPECIVTPQIFVDRIVKIPEGGWKGGWK